MKKIMIVAVAILICLYAVPVSAQANAVSVGKSYELVTPASTGYPDTEAHKLTNGVFAAPITTNISDTSGVDQNLYQSTEYVGFNKTAVDTNGNFVIILDLGSVMTDLSNFELSYLNETDIGIYAPSSVTFSVSDVRNGSYTPVGVATIDEPTTLGISEAKKAIVTPEGAVSGQYVMIEVKHRGSFTDESGAAVSAGWVFLDEITVNGTGADVTSTNDSSTTNNVPQTGDSVTLIIYMFIAFAAILIAGSVIKRRKPHEPK